MFANTTYAVQSLVGGGGWGWGRGVGGQPVRHTQHELLIRLGWPEHAKIKDSKIILLNGFLFTILDYIFLLSSFF